MAAWEILDIAWGRRDGDGALASDDSGGEGGPPPPVHPLAIEDGEVSDPYDPEGDSESVATTQPEQSADDVNLSPLPDKSHDVDVDVTVEGPELPSDWYARNYLFETQVPSPEWEKQTFLEPEVGGPSSSSGDVPPGNHEISVPPAPVIDKSPQDPAAASMGPPRPVDPEKAKRKKLLKEQMAALRLGFNRNFGSLSERQLSSFLHMRNLLQNAFLAGREWQQRRGTTWPA